jgi:Fe-S cluster assembly protein SufD
VVIDHTGTGEHVTNVEVTVGDRSRLVLISVQDWDRSAVQLGRIHSQLGRDASLHQVVATFGGDTVRLVSTVGYDAPGGSADLYGAYFADAGQHLEHRLFADHSAPHCRSNVVYKGALQGEQAHTVWIGDVLIRASAIGTDTYEINRNLVLTDGARADSVPNLEIETGEITGAGHASTTGRFDDEQLFYLQSRGIAADVARRLVVSGFFADVIDQIPTESIRTRLWAAVEDEINLVGVESDQ